MPDNPRRRVTIRDVAARAGVAQGTASKALNDTGSLHPQTRARVKQAADELGYIADVGARALTMQRSWTVGLLSTDDAGRFSLPIVLGAEQALTSGQLSVFLATARHDPVRERHHIREFAARRVDGIIVAGRKLKPREPIEFDGPVVYAYSPSSDPADISVVPDDDAGMALVADHLHALGRRRMAFVGGRVSNPASALRFEALSRAATEHGMAIVTDALEGDWSEKWGRRAVDIVVERQRSGQCEPVDAMVFASDQLARGGCDRLRELGISVPGDIAVTGFDDWDVMALASRPELTTISQCLPDLGQRAAQLLLSAIDGQAQAGIHRQAPRLVVRDSTLGVD